MPRIVLAEEALTRSIIGAFYEVYNTLDFGFLEHLYVLALTRELTSRGHRVELEKSVHVRYKSELLATHRLDMVVDESVIVEVKSTRVLSPVAKRQLLSYLRSTDHYVGLLLHFGPKAEFHRVYCSHSAGNGMPHQQCSGN